MNKSDSEKCIISLGHSIYKLYSFRRHSFEKRYCCVVLSIANKMRNKYNVLLHHNTCLIFGLVIKIKNCIYRIDIRPKWAHFVVASFYFCLFFFMRFYSWSILIETKPQQIRRLLFFGLAINMSCTWGFCLEMRF